MSEQYVPGTVLTLTRGDFDRMKVTVVESPVNRESVFTEDADGAGWWLDTYEDRQWEVSEVTPPKPDLPTEPGWYMPTGSDEPVRVHSDGSVSGAMRFALRDEWLTEHLPLRRLAPVSETAAEIVKYINTYWLPGNTRVFSYGMEERLLKRFGVVSETEEEK